MHQPTMQAITTLIFTPLVLLGLVVLAWRLFCRFYRDENAEMQYRAGDGEAGTVKDIRVAWQLAKMEDRQRDLAKQKKTLLSGKSIETETGLAIKKATERNGQVPQETRGDRGNAVAQERRSSVRRIYPR